MTEVSISRFAAMLSPSALACFRVMVESAGESYAEKGPQTLYEAPLDRFLEECGGEVADVANCIREIIQMRVEVKTGEFQFFYPFLSSVRIEEGVVRYAIPREIEGSLPELRVSGNV